MKTRIFFISSIFIVLYFGLISNIYKLQITKGPYYLAKAESQNRLSGFLEASRGSIYFTDKNDNHFPAAINKEYFVVFAVPKEISADGEAVINNAAEQIASMFQLNREELVEAFSSQTNQYYPILKKATQEQVNEIKGLGIKGIYIENKNFRHYPLGQVSSQVLGFVSPSSDNDLLSGKYGTELFFNEELSGKNGQLQGNKVVDLENGKDVFLTIDSTVENRAEAILEELIKKYNAPSGSVIVQDPKTGKIIALGNYPNFDPNNYSEYKIKDFLNPVVQSIYEPGSVFKVITMAIGLDAGKLTADTTYVDSGFIKLNGKTIKNWDYEEKGPHGKTTMTGVIEGSLNTGAAYAGQLIGKDIFYNYLIKFGFNQTTGIELPGEVTSDIKKLKSSSKDVDFATASFGQGLAVSPIAMINAFSAIANGGELMSPFIVAGTEPRVVRRVISKQASVEAIKMMVSAVDKAYVARIPGYYVAGKTGTAQIADPVRGGYLANDYTHTYIGFAPAYDPKFVILIKLDKPEGAPLAGTTVVPAFRELADFLLNYYNVRPDYISK
ncbi:MAG: peptidoglycan D,D-transpeptidase FtsI family protein [Minisyncoccota bacterium]